MHSELLSSVVLAALAASDLDVRANVAQVVLEVCHRGEHFVAVFATPIRLTFEFEVLSKFENCHFFASDLRAKGARHFSARLIDTIQLLFRQPTLKRDQLQVRVLLALRTASVVLGTALDLAGVLHLQPPRLLQQLMLALLAYHGLAIDAPLDVQWDEVAVDAFYQVRHRIDLLVVHLVRQEVHLRATVDLRGQLLGGNYKQLPVGN